MWMNESACTNAWAHDVHVYTSLHYMNVYALLPICAFGFLLNHLALFLLCRPPKITSGVFVYLSALLVSNIVRLVFVSSRSVPYICDKALADRTQSHSSLYSMCLFYHKYFLYLLPRLVATVTTAHVWLMAALALHRAWKTAHPMSAYVNDTINRAGTTISLVLLGAVIFRAPLFLELQVSQTSSNQGVVKENSRLANNDMYNVVYHVLVASVLAHVLPFILTLMGCCVTLYNLHNSNRRFLQRHISARQRSQLQATGSILAIVVVHLIFHSVSLYELCVRWQLVIGWRSCLYAFDHVLSECAVLLSVLSSCFNAFIFATVTNSVKQHLAGWRKPSRQSNSSIASRASHKVAERIVHGQQALADNNINVHMPLLEKYRNGTPKTSPTIVVRPILKSQCQECGEDILL